MNAMPCRPDFPRLPLRHFAEIGNLAEIRERVDRASSRILYFEREEGKTK